MRTLTSSAVALLAGAVTMGVLAQSASAATITWTNDTSSFSTVPVTFNPAITSCVGTCSNAVVGTTTDDRSPFQNNPPGGAQAPGYNTTPYSAVQGKPSSIPSSATYDFSLGGAITNLVLLWGSPDTYNNLEFWSGNPALAGSVDVGGLSGDAAHGGAAGGGALPLASPLQLGHDMVDFVIPASADVTWLVFSTTTNAFEYSFQTLTQKVGTPLPAALPLLATGLGALGMFGWRRKRKASATPAAA